VPAYAQDTEDDEWIDPLVRPERRAPPLTLASPPVDILQRLQEGPSLWGSLWADYQMVYYGPQSYTAEPRAYRFQVWVSQPDRSLEIFNELSDTPELRHITLQGRSYTSAIRYTGAYLDPGWKHDAHVLLTNPLLRETVFPGDAPRFKAAMRIQPQRLERIAGQLALVVDFTPLDDDEHSFRLWIDRKMGLILRRQHFEPGTGAITSDMLVTNFMLDASFPAALFNPVHPWQGGFAVGPFGSAGPDNSGLQPTPTWALPLTP
jgi:hypothetical protein